MNIKHFKIFNTSIPNLQVILRSPMSDKRGFFQRLFCFEELNEFIKSKSIVQINYSFTRLSGTVRGLHYQVPPFSETKIVSCIMLPIKKSFSVVRKFRKKEN